MSLLDDLDTSGLPGYIVVEGVIGVGKTTLVKRLSEFLNARTVLEVFEENPFLADFYSDRGRYAFQTEMFFLLSRYRQQEGFAQEDLFSRHAVSDYLFSKCRIFAGLTLSEPEFALFDKIYGILEQSVPKPDLVIYLHAPVTDLMDRIASRGRTFEQAMDRDYISGLLGIYTDVFAHYNDTPLLTVDTSTVDFSRDDAAVVALIKEVGRARAGRRSFP